MGGDGGEGRLVWRMDEGQCVCVLCVFLGEGVNDRRTASM